MFEPSSIYKDIQLGTREYVKTILESMQEYCMPLFFSFVFFYLRYQEQKIYITTHPPLYPFEQKNVP